MKVCIIMSARTRIFIVLCVFLRNVNSFDFVFVDDPSKIDSGTVYIPPEGSGDVVVVCSTITPADITWTQIVGGVESTLDNSTLNITQVTDRKSVLYVREGDFAAIGLLYDSKDRKDRKFVCRANQNSTGEFRFIQGSPPEFENAAVNISLEEGQQEEIPFPMRRRVEPTPSVNCTVTNETGTFPVQTWFLPSDDNRTSDFHRTIVIYISGQPYEAGQYKCFARNRFGVAQSKPVTVLYFDVSIHAGPPSGVRLAVTNVSSNSFMYRLIVESHGNSPITSLTIRCTDHHDDFTNASTCAKLDDHYCQTMFFAVNDTISDTHTVDGLHPNSTYYCQVFAENAVGSGQSDVLQVELPATVPDPPTVSCEDFGSMYIKVGWTVGFDGGNKIKGYTVSYESDASNTLHRCSPVEMLPNGGSCLFGDLNKDLNQYSISVVAINDAGGSSPGMTKCNATCVMDFDYLMAESDQSEREDGSPLLKFVIKDSQCGNVSHQEVKRCDETDSLESELIRSDSESEVWISVKGLESGDNCISVNLTTHKGFSGMKTVNVTVSKWSSDTVIAIAIAVSCSLFALLIACGCVRYHYKCKGDAESTSNGLEMGTGNGNGNQGEPQASTPTAPCLLKLGLGPL